MIAENDLALGRLVEAISKSRFWKESAIFVLEDDAQNGPDHVDAHRSVALVVSPYTRRKAVDSTLYTTAGMLRTMELILGLPPMSQYDAAAAPMYRAFQAAPDLAPFTHREARVALDEKNGAHAYGAAASAAMDLDGAGPRPGPRAQRDPLEVGPRGRLADAAPGPRGLRAAGRGAGGSSEATTTIDEGRAWQEYCYSRVARRIASTLASTGGSGMSTKYVYAFGGGTAEGDGSQKDLLGGKGAGLAEMSRIGIPVPPGFTITTEVCTFYQDHDGSYPESLAREVAEQLARLEAQAGQRFGDPENPLLVSVRSGAARSMPGMMDTILNLGLSEAASPAWIARGEDARFVLDAYRRLLTMYGDVVLGVPHSEFEKILGARPRGAGGGQRRRADRGVAARRGRRLRGADREARGQAVPAGPARAALGRRSAPSSRAGTTRGRASTARSRGSPTASAPPSTCRPWSSATAATTARTGVAFTRNPATGERRVYGEYLINAQGEDVVAGIRTPKPIVGEKKGKTASDGLAEDFPEASRQLLEVCEKLERHYRDMQDVEFTIQHDELFMLQTRVGQAHRPRRRAHRRRDGGGGADRPRGGARPRPARPARPAPRPRVRPRAEEAGVRRRRAPRPRPPRRPRRRLRADRADRREGGRDGGGRQRAGAAGARRDLARGHRRHARRGRHPDLAGRHDLARRRGRPRPRQALRGRRRRPRRRRGGRDRAGRGSAPSARGRSCRSTAPPAR